MFLTVYIFFGTHLFSAADSPNIFSAVTQLFFFFLVFSLFIFNPRYCFPDCTSKTYVGKKGNIYIYTSNCLFIYRCTECILYEITILVLKHPQHQQLHSLLLEYARDIFLTLFPLTLFIHFSITLLSLSLQFSFPHHFHALFLFFFI